LYHTTTKGEEVTGGWMKLHKEELCNLDSLQSIIIVPNQDDGQGMLHIWGDEQCMQKFGQKT
jgi:hypothetical protein